MTDIPKIKDIVTFSIDYVCDLFLEKNIVGQDELFNVEEELIKKFSLRNCDSVQCLFRPVYWYLKDNYLVTVREDPMSDKLQWVLKNGAPDRKYFKQKVLEDKTTMEYLNFHLNNAQSFS